MRVSIEVADALALEAEKKYGSVAQFLQNALDALAVEIREERVAAIRREEQQKTEAAVAERIAAEAALDAGGGR
jgi:hypothetical protein